MAIPSHLRCDDVVERVSDYLERALAPSEAEQLEQHLLLCSGCAAYVEQLRAVVAATAKLRDGLNGAGQERPPGAAVASDQVARGRGEAEAERSKEGLDAGGLERLLRAFRSRTQGDE